MTPDIEPGIETVADEAQTVADETQTEEISEDLTLFLESRRTTCNDRTMATYTVCIEHFGRWLAGRPISAMVIGAYIAEVRATRSMDTARNHRRMLQTMCRWLCAVGRLESNPFEGPGRVPSLPSKRRRQRAYTDDQVVALLTASGPIWWKQERTTTREQWQPGGPLEREALQQRALVLLLVDTAIRASEACSISCGDVRRPELVIRGKGDQDGVLFLTADTRAVLLQLAAERAGSDPLFRNWRGERCAPRDLRTLLRRLARRAGVELPPRPLHAFRHYAARTWQRSGLNDLTIQQLMRHSDLRTTQMYTGLDTEALASAHARSSPIGRLLQVADAG